jgi:maltose O-acetyltransferase
VHGCVSGTPRLVTSIFSTHNLRSSETGSRFAQGIVQTEKEKMLAGELYDPLDAQLSAERRRARDLCQALNNTRDEETAGRARVLRELFGRATDVWMQPPFYCDYGYNITLGTKVFFNFNCVVLDVMQVKIGSNVLFGPAVQIYTAMHPVSAAERRKWLEFAKPVEIGSDVWVGGGAIICPGVKIGAGTVIGAGAVVTRDVPAGLFAAGNPCRVIRELTE